MWGDSRSLGSDSAKCSPGMGPNRSPVAKRVVARRSTARRERTVNVCPGQPSTTACGMDESRHSGATLGGDWPHSTPHWARSFRRRSGRYGAPMLSRRTRMLIFAVPVAASLALAAPAMAAGESKGDKAILKAGVITKADVPAEWTSKKGKSSGDALKGIKECKKINTAVAAAKQDDPRARSREFSDPVPANAKMAENSVFAFPDKKCRRQVRGGVQGVGGNRVLRPAWGRGRAKSTHGRTTHRLADHGSPRRRRRSARLRDRSHLHAERRYRHPVHRLHRRAGRAGCALGFAFTNVGRPYPAGSRHRARRSCNESPTPRRSRPHPFG